MEPINFNPRTREGCDFRPAGSAGPFRDFNPRTREGCDLCQSDVFRLKFAISIHAPVKGATWYHWHGLWSSSAFQSTHPWRVRLLCEYDPTDPSSISIHAPVKGATRHVCAVFTDCRFQSTHPWRVRLLLYVLFMLVILNFNPRTREGCDPANGKAASAARRNFNPRTREGCDDSRFNRGKVSDDISIHAPVKGATP